MKDPYAAQCAWSMQALRRQYPRRLWADPNEFFTDGALVNLGSDFGLMPSLFEPSGVVQQEFFAGGTPVIAFKTGGLKDSVFEWNAAGPGVFARVVRGCLRSYACVCVVLHVRAFVLGRIFFSSFVFFFAGTGNGFTFEAHAHGDFVQAVRRALNVYNNKDDYEALRKSARASVLDMEDCALGWIREFVRIRKRIWAQPEAVQKFRDALKEHKQKEQQQKEQEQQQQQQQPTQQQQH